MAVLKSWLYKQGVAVTQGSTVYNLIGYQDYIEQNEQWVEDKMQDYKNRSGLQFIKFDFVTGGQEIKIAILGPWPSRSARLALAISEWLCSLPSQIFPLNYFTSSFVCRAQ